MYVEQNNNFLEPYHRRLSDMCLILNLKYSTIIFRQKLVEYIVKYSRSLTIIVEWTNNWLIKWKRMNT